jgi:RNA polymerase sigma factor (sigma-70 family)
VKRNVSVGELFALLGIPRDWQSSESSKAMMDQAALEYQREPSASNRRDLISACLPMIAILANKLWNDKYRMNSVFEEPSDIVSLFATGIAPCALRWKKAGGACFRSFLGQSLWFLAIDHARELTKTRNGKFRGIATVSLDALVIDTDRPITIEDERIEAPNQRLDASDAVDFALYALDERESQIMRQWIGYGENLFDIGLSFGISESRTCQIVARCKKKLQKFGGACLPVQRTRSKVSRSVRR